MTPVPSHFLQRRCRKNGSVKEMWVEERVPSLASLQRGQDVVDKVCQERAFPVLSNGCRKMTMVRPGVVHCTNATGRPISRRCVSRLSNESRLRRTLVLLVFLTPSSGGRGKAGCPFSSCLPRWLTSPGGIAFRLRTRPLQAVRRCNTVHIYDATDWKLRLTGFLSDPSGVKVTTRVWRGWYIMASVASSHVAPRPMERA